MPWRGLHAEYICFEPWDYAMCVLCDTLDLVSRGVAIHHEYRISSLHAFNEDSLSCGFLAVCS